MRIELNSGGLFSGPSVHDLISEYRKMLKKSREVTRLFKVVRSRIDEMNGGIGNLRTGYDELTSRINKTEYQRSKRIQDNGDRIVNFLNNAQKTDRAVAGKITIDNIRFGMKNPWAVEKSLKEKVFSGLSAIGDWFTDWSGTVRFMKKHAVAIKKILIGVAVVAAIAAVIAIIVLSGGTAAPLLVAALKGAVVFGLAGAATSAAVSGFVEKKSGGEVFDDAADGFMRGTFVGVAWAAMGAIAAGTSSAVSSGLVSSGLTKSVASTAASMLGSVGNLFLKTGGYFAANVAGEGASYMVTGKGFEDGFVINTLGKSIVMGGTDAVASIFGRTLFTAMGRELPFSSLATKSWGNAFAGLLLPSAGGIVGGIMLDNSNNPTLSKIGYGIAGSYGSTVTPETPQAPQSSGVDPKILIKTPGAKLQNPRRIDYLKQSISNDIGKRLSDNELNRASLMTRDRIQRHFSYFTGGSYEQCLSAGVCY